jgi:hypothetical protein
VRAEIVADMVPGRCIISGGLEWHLLDRVAMRWL